MQQIKTVKLIQSRGAITGHESTGCGFNERSTPGAENYFENRYDYYSALTEKNILYYLK
jgi:hypothetical protein